MSNKHYHSVLKTGILLFARTWTNTLQTTHLSIGLLCTPPKRTAVLLIYIYFGYLLHELNQNSKLIFSMKVTANILHAIINDYQTYRLQHQILRLRFGSINIKDNSNLQVT